MTLRNRAIVFLTLVCLAVVLLAYGLAQYLLLNAIAAWEIDDLSRHTLRVEQLLESETRHLAALVEDWAYWDDAMDFVQTGSLDFVTSNFDHSTFDNLNLQFVVILNNLEEIVYSAYYTDGMIKDPPNELLPLLLSLSAQSLGQGHVSLGETLASVAMRPILDSARILEPAGTLIMGRFFDDALVADFSSRLFLQLDLLPPADAERNYVVGELGLTSYHFVTDIWGQELGTLQIYVPREVFLATQRAVRLLLWGLVGIAVITSWVAVMFFDTFLFSRLGYLMDSMRTIFDPSQKPSRPGRTYGDDELTQFSAELQDMLARLEVSQRDLKDSEERLEQGNRMLSILAAATSEFMNTPIGNLDYDAICQYALNLTGARLVVLNLHDQNSNHAETMGVAVADVSLDRLQQLLGQDLRGARWSLTGLGKFQNLHEASFNQIAVATSVEIEQELQFGHFYGVELAQHGRPLGNLLLGLPLGQELVEPEIIDVFARNVSGYLLRTETEEALRESEDRYRTLIETAPNAIIVSDPHGQITLANEQAAMLHGLENGSDLVGKNTLDLVAPQDRSKVKVAMKARLKGETQLGLERALLRSDGSEFFAEVTATAIMSATTGEPMSFLYVYLDVTERKKVEERLRFLSLHDQLTGLYNRAYFEAEMNRLEDGRQHPVSIIVADLNGLKLVNDTLGHKKGDELLQSVAKILQSNLRRSDTLARVGGDEFALALPRTDEALAQLVLERIRASLEEHNTAGLGLPLSLSLGVATSNSTGMPLEDTYGKADSLMYQDKQEQVGDYRRSLIESLVKRRPDPRGFSKGHEARVKGTCLSLGRASGLDEMQLDQLATLAQAHDVGQASVPVRILEKPGTLTQEEWELLSEHSAKGYHIALSSPDLSSLANLILHHHENWDGSGYPTGISGKEIPIECRIFSIADALDAMVSPRPYRTMTSKAEALEEIERCSGTQFDPALVDLLVKILTEE